MDVDGLEVLWYFLKKTPRWLLNPRVLISEEIYDLRQEIYDSPVHMCII